MISNNVAFVVYAQEQPPADLRLCWSHIPDCWKSDALAHDNFYKTVYIVVSISLADVGVPIE